jgi:hypothetical protein
MSVNLEGYNKIAQLLLQPFDAEDLSYRLKNPKKPEGPYNPKFTYVKPHKYRYRLHKIFEQGYSFKIHDVVFGAKGLTGYAYFKADVPEYNVSYEFDVLFSEDYTFAAEFIWNQATQTVDLPNPKAGEIIGLSETMQMANSAGLKAVCRELGIGLNLYDDKDEAHTGGTYTPSGNGATTAPATNASAPADNGEWTGEKVIGGNGKFKDKKWNDPEVDDGYVNWCAGKFGPTSDGQREKNRRAAGNVAAGAAQAAKAAPTVDPTIPF